MKRDQCDRCKGESDTLSYVARDGFDFLCETCRWPGGLHPISGEPRQNAANDRARKRRRLTGVQEAVDAGPAPQEGRTASGHDSE